ncbi:MAG: hypothetical protein ACRERD_34815 [Candidatus Binatia bacterium]
MRKQLKKAWFVRSSIPETIKNIVTTANPGYVRRIEVADFEKELIHEVRFLAPYNPKEIQEAEQYIHAHRSELYQLAKSLSH